MAGTTYQDLNNLITTIRESGYLEGRWTTEQSPARGDTKYDHQVEQEEEGEEEEENEDDDDARSEKEDEFLVGDISEEV